MRDVQFFGRITAGFTHEMKNVLAIIKESSGLMEDFLSMCPAESFPYRERFSKSLAAIAGQVQRGVELSSRLNRFAHSPDRPGSVVVDLNELSEQMVHLSHRFARIKGVALKALPAEGAVEATAAPVPLQMLIFSLLECCWTRMEGGGEICLCVVGTGSDPGVDVLCVGPCSGESLVSGIVDSELWRELQEMADGLGGALEARASYPGFSLKLPGTNDA